MKTITILLLMSWVGIVNAQWPAARWDEKSDFRLINIIDDDLAFFAGLDSNQFPLILKTLDGGVNYDTILFPASTVSIKNIQFLNEDTGFTVVNETVGNKLYKTTNGGNSWQLLIPNQLDAYHSYFIDENVGFIVNNSGIEKTNDGGASWTLYSTQITDPFIKFVDTNTGFISGTTNSQNDAILMGTSNGGNTWDTLFYYHDPSLTLNYFKKVNVIDPNTIYTYLDNTNKIFQTLDGGISWDTITVSSVQFIQDISFISATEGFILSTDGKIFRTTDSGTTWVKEYEVTGGFYGATYALNGIDTKGTTGYSVGTNGLIKKRTISVSVKEIEQETADFKIYPNPATSIIRIDSEQEIKSLQIYDLLGKKIMSNNYKNRVEGILTINLDSLQPGNYILSIGTENGRFLIKKLCIQ